MLQTTIWTILLCITFTNENVINCAFCQLPKTDCNHSTIHMYFVVSAALQCYNHGKKEDSNGT